MVSVVTHSKPAEEKTLFLHLAQSWKQKVDQYGFSSAALQMKSMHATIMDMDFSLRVAYVSFPRSAQIFMFATLKDGRGGLKTRSVFSS